MVTLPRGQISAREIAGAASHPAAAMPKPRLLSIFPPRMVGDHTGPSGRNKQMKPQDVLAHPANVLSDTQRRAFFEQGFVVLPDYVPERWLMRLRAAMAELLDRSRSKSKSDRNFELVLGHSPRYQRHHRLTIQ